MRAGYRYFVNVVELYSLFLHKERGCSCDVSLPRTQPGVLHWSLQTSLSPLEFLPPTTLQNAGGCRVEFATNSRPNNIPIQLGFLAPTARQRVQDFSVVDHLSSAITLTHVQPQVLHSLITVPWCQLMKHCSHGRRR